MNTQNNNLFVIFCFIVLIAGCSNQPKIISATEDKVVVKAPANKFTNAYDLAKKECEKNTRTTKYITDSSESLEEVAFDCIAPVVEEEVVAETEAATSTEEENVAESDTEAESSTEEEIEIQTETDLEQEQETIIEEEIAPEAEEIPSQ
jgi:hypothetical protein